MMHIEIKRAGVHDLDQLQAIGRQTFQEAFGADNTEENMNNYLDTSFSVAQLTTELNNPNAEFYLALLHERVIGYLKVNFAAAQTELRDDTAMEIERIYVLREFHGNGVGQLLLAHALQLARQRKADYVWLGVWEKNLRAISFYKKNGFTEFKKHLFRLGGDEQLDIMMKRELTPARETED